MVEITCHCGHTANYSDFLRPDPPPRGDVRHLRRLELARRKPQAANASAWWRCPKCGDKFRGPAGVQEIGVQLIRDGIRSEIPPADKVTRELREWWREQATARETAARSGPAAGRQLQKSFPFEF
jgi:hypothetical protein